MRRFGFVIFIILAVFAVPVYAQDQGLQQLDDAWTKAFVAGNVEAVVALYAADAVMYPPDSMEARGTKAIKASYAAFLNANKVQDFKMLDQKYETKGDLSYGSSRWTMTVVPKAGGEGKPVNMEGRASSVAKKIGGKWLYILDHASVPVPPPPTIR